MLSFIAQNASTPYANAYILTQWVIEAFQQIITWGTPVLIAGIAISLVITGVIVAKKFATSSS